MRAVFELLDRWRHLPAYQLERRADVFFALYLPEILERAVGMQIEERVVPEFPIKHEDGNASDRADYFLISKDQTRAFLLELKTDMASRKPKQDAYLRTAQTRGLRRLVHDVLEIMTAKKTNRQKYFHLLRELEELGLVSVSPDLESYTFPRVKPGFKKQLLATRVSRANPPIEIVYLQPRDSDGDRVITFREAASTLRTLDDPLATEFARYVEAWAAPAARHSSAG